MKKYLVSIIAIIILIIGFYSLRGCDNSFASPEEGYELYKYQMEGDEVWGDENALVTIIEYSSFMCPHCADLHKILESLEDDYIKTGKVKLISRPVPLNNASLYGSMIAYCSKDNYYQIFKMLFDYQKEWVYSDQYMEKLGDIARLSGMSKEDFDTCIADNILKNRIRMDIAKAIRGLQINATPTIFINGNRYIGDKSLNELKSIIESELNKKIINN